MSTLLEKFQAGNISYGCCGCKLQQYWDVETYYKLVINVSWLSSATIKVNF